MPEPPKYAIRFISMAVASFITLAGCFFLGGCGGSSSSPVPSNLAFAMNGNFSLVTTSAATSEVNTFGGAVQTDRTGHVSGTVHVQGPFFQCFLVLLDLPLAGTIDSTGHLNATITGLNNQTITLTANVSSDGALLSNGSYAGSATGCVAGDHGTLTGFQVQAFTGTYSGSFNPSPSTNIGLQLSLIQSPVANIHGSFPVSASSIAVTGGAACGFSSATLVAGGSVASGNDLGLLLLGSDNSSIMIFVGTVMDGNTNVVNGLIFINTGPCSGQNALVNLSRP